MSSSKIDEVARNLCDAKDRTLIEKVGEIGMKHFGRTLLSIWFR